MALLQYLKVIRRRWRVVLACFLLATITGYIISPEQSAEPMGPGFEAALTLIPPADVSTPPNLYLAAHLTTTPDVAALAAEQLPPDVRPRDELAITGSVSPEAGALTITATDLDRERAILLAQAYATATIHFLSTATAGSQEGALAAAQKELESVEESIDALQKDVARNPNNAVIEAQLQTEMARYGIVFQRVQDLLSAGDSPATLQVLGTPEVTALEAGGISAPNDRRARALLAGVLGLVLGFGVALAVDRLDARLRERDEAEEAFGLPVLGEIPRVGRRARADHALITTARPDSTAAEAYRSLRSAITLVAQSRANDGGAVSTRQQTHQVLVVTAAHGHEGKSTTVVNLAATLAETDKTVIVIDCDFRKPEAHRFLGVAPGRGLVDVAEANFNGNIDQVIQPTAVPGVSLVTNGKAVSQPTSVFARLPGIIADARRRADVVLIDSSPLLAVSEAVDVLQYADAALVVCRLGRTTFEHARRSRRLLQRAEVPLLGVVLTGISSDRGTPYGQPSRGQALRARLASWVETAGHAPLSNGATEQTAQKQPAVDTRPDIRVQEHPADDTSPDVPAQQQWHDAQDVQEDQPPIERRYQRRHERGAQWPSEPSADRPPMHYPTPSHEQPGQTDDADVDGQPAQPGGDHSDEEPETRHEAAWSSG